jgi:hypothetical protein
MPLTVSQLMEKMPGAFLPEKAQGVNATIHFKFTGAEAGDWNAKIADGKVATWRKRRSERKGDHDLTADSEDYVNTLHRRTGWDASLHAGKTQIRRRLEPGDEVDADVQDQVKKLRS